MVEANEKFGSNVVEQSSGGKNSILKRYLKRKWITNFRMTRSI